MQVVGSATVVTVTAAVALAVAADDTVAASDVSDDDAAAAAALSSSIWLGNAWGVSQNELDSDSVLPLASLFLPHVVFLMFTACPQVSVLGFGGALDTQDLQYPYHTIVP